VCGQVAREIDQFSFLKKKRERGGTSPMDEWITQLARNTFFFFLSLQAYYAKH